MLPLAEPSLLHTQPSYACPSGRKPRLIPLPTHRKEKEKTPVLTQLGGVAGAQSETNANTHDVCRSDACRLSPNAFHLSFHVSFKSFQAQSGLCKSAAAVHSSQLSSNKVYQLPQIQRLWRSRIRLLVQQKFSNDSVTTLFAGCLLCHLAVQPDMFKPKLSKASPWQARTPIALRGPPPNIPGHPRTTNQALPGLRAFRHLALDFTTNKM